MDAFEAELATGDRQHAVACRPAPRPCTGLLAGGRPRRCGAHLVHDVRATANAIVYTGAEPVFVDSDQTGNMHPDLLEAAFDLASRQGRRVAAVVPIDFLGKVADHQRIDPIAEAHGVPVLADAAESVGATRAGRSSASYGVASTLSFNGNKVMTTSGGGALLTDDAASAAQVRYLATQARQPVVHYEHTDIGYNYRLSNCSQPWTRATEPVGRDDRAASPDSAALPRPVRSGARGEPVR